MNKAMGIEEFSSYWRKLIDDVKNCESTKNDAQEIETQFTLAELSLKMSKPFYWYTAEIQNQFEQLKSELRIALLKAQSNYRKGYGESKINAITESVKAILKRV